MSHLLRLTKPLAVAAAALAYSAAAPALSIEALHGQRAITCVNKSSGTKWQINVDYDHSTVDTNAASISDSKIDRKSVV